MALLAQNSGGGTHVSVSLSSSKEVSANSVNSIIIPTLSL